MRKSKFLNNLAELAVFFIDRLSKTVYYYTSFAEDGIIAGQLLINHRSGQRIKLHLLWLLSGHSGPKLCKCVIEISELDCLKRKILSASGGKDS
jgi:hypothetical protein